MRLAFAFALLLAAPPVEARAQVAEPEGYRTENYRAPVPATLAGARVADTAGVERLWKDNGAAFIDVLPRPPKPANLPADTVWRDKPRRDIPGSLWLPDTGYGRLPEAVSAYLSRGLGKASNGDKSRLLVFYCLRDCWMSWNAAKRAISLGYRNVIWYPDGTDGWAAAGLRLEDRTPEPRG
ncbi:MAG: PQQ-dependent catabolism-associated CXXCW motif protein [Hyphomicrobiales bacterium]|nr:PQQ-dependent catabolism-associated CXXCW motif protein [Hyphomicrobiales bacterium]